MKKLIHILIILAMNALAATANAQVVGEQFYFTAISAPQGSISGEGQSAQGVYLRWDVLEGQLPADVVNIRIERDGVELDTLPANGVMGVAQIDALYAGPFQVRRKAETLRWLNEYAQSTPEFAFDSVDAGNFAQAIQARLTNGFYAAFASRIDFNLAQARYRAFLDTGLAPGIYEYELIAISSNGDEARLGLASVDLAAPYTLLDGPADLKQIADYGRCDAPEDARDHGVVALNWSHPGPGPADRLASGIVVAGYDIYRSDSNVDSLDLVDLRMMAAGTSAQANGEVVLPGLEKVNDQPILLSGSAQSEQTHRGWNPEYVQHLETARELTTAGINPGDKRAYHVVARDITGNYGRTASLLVTVPDRAAPPAPYNVRVLRNEFTGSFKLVWDEINVASYYANNRTGRNYCNLNTARLDQRLEYVSSGESCTVEQPSSVDLDVKEYIVYRWRTDQAGAASFTDRDGDGFSDADERVSVPGQPNLTLPGTSCTEAATEGGPWLADVPDTAVVVRTSGRRVLEFEDAQPAVNRGEVFWYRLAARDAGGEVGALSPPIRGFFPDRHRPDRDDLSGVVYGIESCPTSVQLIDLGQGEPIIQDATERGLFARLSCSQGALTEETWLPIVDGVPRRAPIGQNTCKNFAAHCVGPVSAAYFDAAGDQLGESVVGSFNPAQCDFGGLGTRLVEDCGSPQVVDVTPGEVTAGPLIVDYTLPPGRCLTIYRERGDDARRIDTLCDQTELPYTIDIATFGGTQICLSVALSDDNAEESERERLPCVTAPTQGVPGKPQVNLTAFDLVASTASLSLLPPQQFLAGSIVEWFELDSPSTTRASRFISHLEATRQDGAIDVIVDLPAAPVGAEWAQTWCSRAQAVGFAVPGADASLSGWGERTCLDRLPVTVALPPQLGWPAVPVPETLAPVSAFYLEADKVPAIRLSDAPMNFTSCDVSVPQCDGANCLSLDSNPATFVAFCPNFCDRLIGGADTGTSFVVYRQSSSNPADVASYGPLVQISPLIEKFFCRSTGNTSTGADPFLFLADFTAIGEPGWEGIRMAYVDRQPHIVGRHYRYQLVYFDARGEISHTRWSPWVEAGTP